MTSAQFGGTVTQRPIGYFEVFKDKRKKWRWRYKITGEIVADSGQGYSRKRDAKRAIRSLVHRIRLGDTTIRDV